jgi:predicted short-subunit dehydrogenase-like oxidoreductase (DUF2520 family)
VEEPLRAKKKLPITIIGAGPVGTALAIALKRKQYPLQLVLSRKGKSAKTLGRRVLAPYASMRSTERIVAEGIIFIAVPDDEIKNVVQTLSRRFEDFSRSIIFHTSGALSSEGLSQLKRKGASVGSFHPLQTFPKSGVSSGRLKNIWIGIEGDSRAVGAAKRIAQDLDAHPILLSAGQKTLYHIAAVFGSNYFATLLSVIEELGKRIQVPRKKMIAMVEPLILQSLMNVKNTSAAAALTGPIARGDFGTVRKHRMELNKKGLKHISHLYAALAKETSRIASRKAT